MTTLLHRLKTWLPQRKADNATLELFRQIYGGRLSKTGQSITLIDALRCATVFACARVIANGIAQVPLKLFQEDGAGAKLPARQHPLYRVLHRKPNEWQTSFEFREMLALHLVLAGRAYCYKTIVLGRIVELIPFEPGAVQTALNPDGSIVYKVTGRDGAVREFDASVIWHLKGPSWCGWEAMDALDLAREAIGLSIAAEGSQAMLHKNGVRPSGTYSVEGSLSDTQHKQLRQFLADNYAGENSGLPMVLDRGAKWLGQAMTGVDAQHHETRVFQVEEVCRAMGVMPIMVFSSDKASTYASAEAMFQAHVVHTLAAWWERIEQSIDCNLLTPRDAEAGIYAKFIGNGLMRGSMKDRAEYFAKALGSGGSPAWMTQDEVRSYEELNPMGGIAASLPAATNLPAAPDPVQTAKADTMLLQLAEMKAVLDGMPKTIPMQAAPVINVTSPPVNVNSFSHSDMAPVAGQMRHAMEGVPEAMAKALHGMAGAMAQSMSEAVKTGMASVQPPVINLKAADQPPPVVNVRNDVTVQPATVDVKLAMPTRKTTTEVTYDSAGNIVKTVATEKDA